MVSLTPEGYIYWRSKKNENISTGFLTRAENLVGILYYTNVCGRLNKYVYMYVYLNNFTLARKRNAPNRNIIFFKLNRPNRIQKEITRYKLIYYRITKHCLGICVVCKTITSQVLLTHYVTIRISPLRL